MNTISGFMRNPYMTSNHSYANQMGNTQQNSMFSAKRKASDFQRMFSNATETTPRTSWEQSGDSIFSSSQSYGESLRTQRQTAKDTSLQLKKLKYQFKNISSRILRSKTSAAARQVVGQARREVLRLKREKQSGSYDGEEIDAAIEHAKAMERVAKKKVKHLEEEEMAKASGGPCAGNMVEEEKDVSDENSREESTDDVLQEEELQNAQFQGEEDISYDADWSAMVQEYVDSTLSDMEDLTTEMMDELSEGMKEMLSEMGLDELSDSLLSAKGDMDPADLKTMKIKHRNKEMKDIVKADAEYLKAVFDHMEKAKSGEVIPGSTGGTSFGGSADISSAMGGYSPMPQPVINITL